MEKRTARHEDLPIWLKTTPPANQEVDEHDLERSIERLETLLGH